MAKVLVWSFSAAAMRWLLFFLLHSGRGTDALWQFVYFPLWVLDFPITLLYFPFPIPWGEGFVGPVWWFFLPFIVFGLFERKTRK